MAVLAVALGGCAGAGGADGAMSDAERATVAEEAEGVIASMFEAMNAAAADSVLSHYTADPFVRITCTQVQNRALFLTGTRAYYRSRDSLDFRYRITGSRALSSDAAVVSASGGLPDVSGLFWTWVLEREDGQLKIVHEHESWPDCPEPRSNFHSVDRELEESSGMGQPPADTPGG
jgi:ketosteroid isomerase-like protein